MSGVLNFGFAWDVSGDGKTAVRGGHSLSYVNDQEILAPEYLLELNNGLEGIASTTGLSNRVSTGLPQIVAPTYQVSLTVTDNYADNPFNTVGMIDPNLKHPYVQQYSIGIQHQVKGTLFEARYVGNHVVGAYRAFDFNQVVINQNGFLPDFLRAQNNGWLALATSGVFNPLYNGAGSQPLTEITRSMVRDPNLIYYLQTGEVGELGNYLQTNKMNGSIHFYQNPNALGTDLLTNYSSSSYNSLQLEARHQTRSGLSFEANYTFSKVLSDADGDVQSRLQHFLDINNPGIERSRANFDLTHMIKADGFYEFPLGKGHRLHYRPLDASSAAGSSGAPWYGNPARPSRSCRGGERSTANRAPTTTPPIPSPPAWSDSR